MMRAVPKPSLKGARMRASRCTHLVQGLGACLAVAVFLAAVICAADRTVPPTSAAAVRVVIAPGDTLWSIARRLDVPGTSVQEKVSAIRAANGLRTSDLRPGQELLVPIVASHELVAQRPGAAGSAGGTGAR